MLCLSGLNTSALDTEATSVPGLVLKWLASVSRRFHIQPMHLMEKGGTGYITHNSQLTSVSSDPLKTVSLKHFAIVIPNANDDSYNHNGLKLTNQVIQSCKEEWHLSFQYFGLYNLSSCQCFSHFKVVTYTVSTPWHCKYVQMTSMI